MDRPNCHRRRSLWITFHLDWYFHAPSPGNRVAVIGLTALLYPLLLEAYKRSLPPRTSVEMADFLILNDSLSIQKQPCRVGWLYSYQRTSRVGYLQSPCPSVSTCVYPDTYHLATLQPWAPRCPESVQAPIPCGFNSEILLFIILS